jgi:hypothetical protein
MVRRPRPAPAPNADAVRELQLYMENDNHLYNRELEFQKNLARKICSGKYDAAKSPKLFEHFVKEGAAKYKKDLGEGHFTPADRRAVAENYASDFERIVREFRAGDDGSIRSEVASILESCKR